jgi:glutaminyl-peptide cyclotransferase
MTSYASRFARLLRLLLLGATTLPVFAAPQAAGVSGQHVFDLTRQLLAVAPKRFANSPGHYAAEKFIKDHFKPEQAAGSFQTDAFLASTPVGQIAMRNYIVKYPGKKDGIIVLASHYETNYPLKDINFYGANDGACTSALLIALGEHFRTHPPQGYSVWLLFDDGEETVANPPYSPSQWNDEYALYGTRHIAAKWSADGTLAHIKAFLLADMIGDKDLNIDYDENSTPWLRDMLRVAARDTGHVAYVYKNNVPGGIDDDHMPFVRRGVPSLDIIDIDYGPHNDKYFDGWHHTDQDTLDKLSAHSLQISADLFLEMIHLIDQR